MAGCEVDRGLYDRLMGEMEEEAVTKFAALSVEERHVWATEQFHVRFFDPDMESVKKELSGKTEYEGTPFTLNDDGEVVFSYDGRTLNELHERARQYKPEIYDANAHATDMLVQEAFKHGAREVSKVSYYRNASGQDEIRDVITMRWDGTRGTMSIRNIAPDGNYHSMESARDTIAHTMGGYEIRPAKNVFVFTDKPMPQADAGVREVLRAGQQDQQAKPAERPMTEAESILPDRISRVEDDRITFPHMEYAPKKPDRNETNSQDRVYRAGADGRRGHYREIPDERKAGGTKNVLIPHYLWRLMGVKNDHAVSPAVREARAIKHPQKNREAVSEPGIQVTETVLFRRVPRTDGPAAAQESVVTPVRKPAELRPVSGEIKTPGPAPRQQDGADTVRNHIPTPDIRIPEKSVPNGPTDKRHPESFSDKGTKTEIKPVRTPVVLFDMAGSERKRIVRPRASGTAENPPASKRSEPVHARTESAKGNTRETDILPVFGADSVAEWVREYVRIVRAEARVRTEQKPLRNGDIDDIPVTPEFGQQVRHTGAVMTGLWLLSILPERKTVGMPVFGAEPAQTKNETHAKEKQSHEAPESVWVLLAIIYEMTMLREGGRSIYVPPAVGSKRKRRVSARTGKQAGKRSGRKRTKRKSGACKRYGTKVSMV